MKCPHCFAENSDNNVFCKECGERLTDHVFPFAPAASSGFPSSDSTAEDLTPAALTPADAAPSDAPPPDLITDEATQLNPPPRDATPEDPALSASLSPELASSDAP